MKKLVFAAIAALVMVSVSNVFASNKMASVSCAAPVDTVAPADTTATPAENEVTPAENAAQDSTAATPVESTDSAATAEYHHLQKTVNNYTSLSIGQEIKGYHGFVLLFFCILGYRCGLYFSIFLFFLHF